MTIVLWAFTLFHAFVATGSLASGVRLITPEERRLWRSKSAWFTALLLCWLYPVAAAFGAWWGWRALEAGQPYALPLLLAPFLFMLVMGVVFALVDFFEDGVLGNARTPES